MLDYSADYIILSLVGLSKRKKFQKPNCAEWQEKAESATESFATLVLGMKVREKMVEYTKHNYGKHGSRMNPNYPPYHCFTVCRCKKCGEEYEADKKHICKKENSYPVEED